VDGRVVHAKREGDRLYLHGIGSGTHTVA
jgi:hypothetical protein